MSLSRQEATELDEAGWQFGFKLKTEHIWDAFVLLSLLRDREAHSRRLELPHKGLQSSRLTEAMQERNERIVTEGQDEIAQSCDRCTRYFKILAADRTEIWRKPEIYCLCAIGLILWHSRSCPSCNDRWAVHGASTLRSAALQRFACEKPSPLLCQPLRQA